MEGIFHQKDGDLAMRLSGLLTDQPSEGRLPVVLIGTLGASYRTAFQVRCDVTADFRLT